MNLRFYVRINKKKFIFRVALKYKVTRLQGYKSKWVNPCDIEPGNIAAFTQGLVVDDPAFLVGFVFAKAVLHVGTDEKVGVPQLLLELLIGQNFTHDGIIFTEFGVLVVDIGQTQEELVALDVTVQWVELHSRHDLKGLLHDALIVGAAIQ